jgi:aminopeptidase
MNQAEFEQKLSAYAELAVKVGLNIHPGQKLLIRGPLTYGVPFSAAPLVREISRYAYLAGARLVDVMWGDAEMELIRFKYAPRDSFKDVTEWKTDGPYQHVKAGNATMTISGMDPDLFKDLDPEIVAEYSGEATKKLKPFLTITGRDDVNWLVLAVPTPGWTAKVFPKLSPAEGEMKMWETLFKLCRLDQPDPVAAWQKHIENLKLRCDYLNARQFDHLHYTAPGTDLKVGLPKGHIWCGASSQFALGFSGTVNLPTEEVFTLPHRERVDGVVSSSLPLNLNGSLINGMRLEFKDGRVVKANAAEGETALQKLIETDEGAAHLGEAALVAHNTPIAQSGLLFYNTLLDENAACHLALGSAYNTTLQGGEKMDEAAFARAGGNSSNIHVDFMIGSDKMDIDGVTADGKSEPILRKGLWAFDVK